MKQNSNLLYAFVWWVSSLSFFIDKPKVEVQVIVDKWDSLTSSFPSIPLPPQLKNNTQLYIQNKMEVVIDRDGPCQ